MYTKLIVRVKHLLETKVQCGVNMLYHQDDHCCPFLPNHQGYGTTHKSEITAAK
ncbi:hypothetical protein JHK86_047941 [Glycine max]|nr:hypothetical protein JHK86_047941 [Glycine max]